MKGDAAIALLTIPLSSPARYGNGRKTSINKNNRASISRARISPKNADSSAQATPRNRIPRYRVIRGLVLRLGKLLTLRQRRRPRVAEAGAHLPREQDYEPEKVSDQYTKTHLRFAPLAVPKDNRYFLDPESPLRVDDQFKSDLKPGGVSPALDKPCPIPSKKPDSGSRRRARGHASRQATRDMKRRHQAQPGVRPQGFLI